MTTLSDVQNLWNKAKHDLESAEHAALGSLEAKRKEAWNSLNAMKHSVSHDLEVLEDGAKAQLSKTGAALKHDLDDIGASYKQLGQDLNSDLKKSGAAIKADIESATDTAIKKLTSEAMVHGLSEADKVVKALHADMEKLEAKLPKLVDALNNIGNSIELGPIQLNYASFYSRAEELSDALDKALEMVKAGDFKLTQTFFNDLVKGLGPDSLTINAEIEFFSALRRGPEEHQHGPVHRDRRLHPRRAGRAERVASRATLPRVRCMAGRGILPASQRRTRNATFHDHRPAGPVRAAERRCAGRSHAGHPGRAGGRSGSA